MVRLLWKTVWRVVKKVPRDTIRFVRDSFDMTILLIEHDMTLVSGICDRLTVLNFGQTLAEGEVGEVLSNPDVIKAYLGD